jgi:hypothetical protein
MDSFEMSFLFEVVVVVLMECKACQLQARERTCKRVVWAWEGCKLQGCTGSGNERGCPT